MALPNTPRSCQLGFCRLILLLCLSCQPNSAAETAATAPTPALGPLADTGEQASLAPKWPEFDRVASWPKVNDVPFVSKGHAAERYDTDVRVSPDQALRYRDLVDGVRFPVGTIIAGFPNARLTHSAGPVSVMQKITQNSWEFLLLRPSGEVVQRARAGLCQRCHAEALTDSLFGLPRAAVRRAPLDTPDASP